MDRTQHHCVNWQVLVASAAGARRGLLLRGGDVLEAAAGVDAVVLDKTGTLTHGRLQLTAASPCGEGSCRP
jgi:P-type E1-E2 ATPase